MPQAAAGDTFVYAGKFTTIPCARWTVTQANQNGYVVSTCGGNTARSLASTGALVDITGPGGATLVKFSPSAPGISFPLAPNKTWSHRYTGFTADDGATFDSQETCKVAGWESVQVPAGALPAYRIACEDHWTAGPASGTTHTTNWYAPQARTVVKSQNAEQPKWNVDLASYSFAH